RPDAQKSAAALAEMVKQIDEGEKRLNSAHHSENGANKIDPMVANRAAMATRELRRNLCDWFTEYNGYDPDFTWWVDMPYQAANKALTGYETFLLERLVGLKPGDTTTIIGDPVGREALMADL